MNRQKLHAALTEEIRQSYKIYEGHYPAMDLAHAMAKDVLGKLAELCVAETPETVGLVILGRGELAPLPVAPKPAAKHWYGFGGAR